MLNKIYKIVSGIFLVIMIVIAAIVVISAFPVKGNIQIKVVLSGSMEPSIKTGSVILIKPVASYNIGDVITFDSNFREPNGARIPVTHRVVEVKKENSVISYLTKGDANEDPDNSTISYKSVIGKVLFSVPYLGYVVETAKKPYGFLALIMIPALIIISDQVKKILDELKRMKMNKKNSEFSGPEVKK
ncbi:MAG: signal peptidase I [Candidatus Staskawiczbacteria bacterium]|nr:signal peptidase I [Candidatus Staskawiczbacteria bacterium]